MTSWPGVLQEAPPFGQHKCGGACGTDQRIVLPVFAQQSLCVANVFAAEGFDQLRRLLCAQGRYHRRICTAQRGRRCAWDLQAVGRTDMPTRTHQTYFERFNLDAERRNQLIRQ